MRAFRLNLDDLDVATFDPVAANPSSADPAGPLLGAYTGCISDCSGCAGPCAMVQDPY